MLVTSEDVDCRRDVGRPVQIHFNTHPQVLAICSMKTLCIVETPDCVLSCRNVASEVSEDAHGPHAGSLVRADLSRNASEAISAGRVVDKSIHQSGGTGPVYLAAYVQTNSGFARAREDDALAAVGVVLEPGLEFPGRRTEAIGLVNLARLVVIQQQQLR